MFSPHALCYDVPQWSTLGPLLFTLYIAVLSPFFLQDVIARHNQAPVVQKMDSAIHLLNNRGQNSLFSADDTQLYIAIDPANQVLSLTALQNCIEDEMQWNTQNMPGKNVTNDERTDLILFTSRYTKTPNIEKLSFDSTDVELTERVRNLGFILDN